MEKTSIRMAGLAYEAMIYHITDRHTWTRSLAAGQHTGSTRDVDLADEGFIHCSTAEQVDGVLERFYAGASDLLVLHIDETKLSAELRYDDVPGAGLFPHVYGPINVDAVVQVERR
jgi:uncharacterized protein (DUF952 family)